MTPPQTMLQDLWKFVFTLVLAPASVDRLSRTISLQVYICLIITVAAYHSVQEWHCTLRGPAGTEFEGGLYHVRILLPAEYPFRPPSLMILTPNGRFELNTKVSRGLYIAAKRIFYAF